MKDKWDFKYIDIVDMINDYQNIKSEELRNCVFNYIEEAIGKSTHNLTFSEIWELIDRLNRQ